MDRAIGLLTGNGLAEDGTGHTATGGPGQHRSGSGLLAGFAAGAGAAGAVGRPFTDLAIHRFETEIDGQGGVVVGAGDTEVVEDEKSATLEGGYIDGNRLAGGAAYGHFGQGSGDAVFIDGGDIIGKRMPFRIHIVIVKFEGVGIADGDQAVLAPADEV